MALKFPDRLESNNPAAYGVVKADQVSGHKTVKTVQELYSLSDAILSASGNNTNNDAIGQQWYIISENCFYELVTWENKKIEAGWRKVSTDKVLQINIDKKVDKVQGKSLVSDLEITKLTELPQKSVLDGQIADAKQAGLDAQEDVNTLNQKVDEEIAEISNPASVNKNGLMSKEDKKKLDNIQFSTDENSIWFNGKKYGVLFLEQIEKLSASSTSSEIAAVIGDATEANFSAIANFIGKGGLIIVQDDWIGYAAAATYSSSGEIKTIWLRYYKMSGNEGVIKLLTFKLRELSWSFEVTSKKTYSIVNNLTTTDAALPLSANMGRVLNNKITEVNNEIEEINNKISTMENMLAYGVEWNINIADPHITRIGNMSLHKTLPIQSQLKGCIAQGGNIIYWLDENDWRWRKTPIYTKTASVKGDIITINVRNGYTAQQYANRMKGVYIRGYNNSDSPSPGNLNVVRLDNISTINTEGNLVSFNYTKITDNGLYCTNWEEGAILNGFDGTVRVYCPEFYIKSQSIEDTRKVWISTIKIDSTWGHQNALLIDAYRSTILNKVPEDMGYLSTLPVNSAISVVNTETYCRGGKNNSSGDQYLLTDPFRSDLGKPRTNISRANMRTYSRNSGSEMLSYEQYKNIFYWLYVIEYANFNVQETYNEILIDGQYHQGGLGNGVTTINYDHWSYYNGRCPITPCGYGNELGNSTGIKQMSITLPTASGAEPSQMYTLGMPRWRGFDNPFGDTWTNLDGVVIDADSDNHPNNMDYVYICSDPSKYSDNLTEDYVKVADHIHADGAIKEFDLGNFANIVPIKVGDSNTTYKCDWFYSGNKDSNLRTVLVGGGSNYYLTSGLGCFASTHSVGSSYSTFGFRSASLFSS